MTNFDDAVAAVERGDWPLAENLLQALAQTQPDSADISHLLGLAFWQRGDFTGAVPYFERAHALAPDFAMPCFYLAGERKMQGDLEGALTWLDKFVKRAPDDPNGWLRQGEVLLALARSAEAGQKLRQALELAPASTDARLLLGHALFNCGQYAETIDCLVPLANEKLLGLDSLRLLCRAAEEIEDYCRAVGFAALLAEASPDQVEDCLILARTLFAAGEEDQGIAAYRDYLTMRSQSAETRKLLPVRVVTTETWELIAARWVSLGLPAETTESGRIRPSLSRHDQALVLAPEWLVVSREGDLLVEQMTHNPGTLRKKSARIPALTATRSLLDLPTATVDIVEACALIGGSTNYYHWLVDHLPRIGILAKSADLHDLHLLVNSDLTRFQRESLEAIGIPPERLILLPADSVAKCRVVWVPTLVSRLTAFHPFVVNWLRRTYLRKGMKDGPRLKLFVSRLDASQRRLLNEAELIEKLRPLGFEVITPGSLGFLDQIAAFARADVIVGPHGAGLTNIIFAPQKARIFELGFSQYPATFFSIMAGQIGQNFIRIDGTAVPNASPLPHTWDFSIDIDAAVAAIGKSLD